MLKRILITVILVMIIPLNSLADKLSDELKNYVEDYLSVVCKMPGFKKRKEKALSNIPYIINICRKYSDEKIQIDPLLVAAIMRLEASWKNDVIGKKGEIGIMQVMPGKISRKYDMSTPQGQIEAGIEKLRYAFDECNYDLKKALTHYASGKCISKSERTKRKIKLRIKHYKNAVERYWQ